MAQTKHVDQWEAGRRRRQVTLRVLRLKAGDRGLTLRELLDLLRALHAAGKWPQSTATSARNEPYDTGTRQHLYAMRSQGKVVCLTDKDGVDRWKLPCPDDFLPDEDAAALIKQAIINARRHGIRDAVLGVTPDCKRVIRVMTRRGEIERWLKPREDWLEVLPEVGIAV